MRIVISLVLVAVTTFLGYWLALCKSPDEYIEIRDAETGKTIDTYKIDMHYRMTHGLPMK